MGNFSFVLTPIILKVAVNLIVPKGRVPFNELQIHLLFNLFTFSKHSKKHARPLQMTAVPIFPGQKTLIKH